MSEYTAGQRVLSARLEAIETQLNAITPGNWNMRECTPCTERGRLEVNIWDETGNLMVTGWCDDAEFHRPDAEFIAAAPENTRFLVSVARRVEVVRELHRARPFDVISDGVHFGQQDFDYNICNEDHERWPCPTIKALDGE